jgi:hypothetical protein
MTAEQFSAEYHLLNSVSSGAIETYHAHAATGAMVMVHFLRGSQQENDEIVDLLARQRADRHKKVMRTVDVDGATAVVTRFILDITTFREWLIEGVGTEPPQPAPPPPPPVALDPPVLATPAHTPGEITRMFMTAAGDAPPPSPAPSPAPVVPSAAPRPEPGELTRMFSAIQPEAVVPAPLPPPSPPPPPQLAHPVAPPPAPPLAPPPPPAHTPGELTMMFAPVAPPPAEPLHIPEPAPPPPPPLFTPPPAPRLQEPVLDFGAITPKKDEPPGNYTRMFAAADYAAAPPPPSAPVLPVTPQTDPAPLLRTNDTYVDRLYRIDVPETPPPPAPSAYQEPAAFAAYGAGEPSEFTRVIASFAPPPIAAAPAPAPAAAPPPAKNSKKPYIIAAVVLVIAVVAMIVAVVFSRLRG